jgi:uncharacterized membrane protein
MADVPVQVIVAAFNDLNGASQALTSLKEAKKERLIEIEDAAVLTKDADGKVKIKETADMRAGKGATIGAIAGGVVGLLAGPVGWAALGGGVVGGLAAKLHDGGFPDDRLRQLAEGLTPDSSALVAVIDHRWVADLERELARQGADVVTEGLRDDIAARLKEGGGIVYTVVDTGEAIVAGPGPQEEAAASADTTDAGAMPPPPDDSVLGEGSQPQQPA